MGGVAQIVDGLSKLTQIEFDATQASNLRRVDGHGNDIRVILVKLADRLHNTRTIEHLELQKQKSSPRNLRDLCSHCSTAGHEHD